MESTSRSQPPPAESTEPSGLAVGQTTGSRTAWFWLIGVLLVCLAVCTVGLAIDWWTCLPDDVQATYVGRQACVACHASETKQWLGSDHDLAMEPATEQSVLADFADAKLTHHGITSRMYRKDGKFMIRTEGPDGKMADFEIKYTFGVRPLQQYMVEFDRPDNMPATEIARLQVLRVSWDTEQKKWFYMPPPDVSDKLEPTDELHWTGIAQRWNNMCAYCHSTNLQKNFDVKTLTYHTTFSEIDVSCEACHGPASIHVQLAEKRSLFWDRKRGYGLVPLNLPDTRAQIQTCAPCHSRRRHLYPNFLPGDNFYDYFSNELLQQATYYADGQIKDEDYVFGSFIQSKMFHNDIRCTDCHNPHTARLKHDGNQVCTSCHQHSGAKYDSEAHHFHKMGTEGAACVECHMPETTYMEVDPRRDHSIRIPRPDLSVALGLPNACTRCHLTDAKIPDKRRAELPQYRDWIEAARNGDKLIDTELKRLDKWADDAVRKWYGVDKDRPKHFAYALMAGRKQQPDAARMLADVASDRKLPGIVRATAILQRGLLDNPPTLTAEIKALRDIDPQVRMAAVSRFFERIPDIGTRRLPERQQAALRDQLAPLARQLVPLLDDPRRNVRAEAGHVLARLSPSLTAALLNGAQREKLDSAIDEYITGVNESSDRGGAHMALGVLYESLGQDKAAENEYRSAIRVEPSLTGARSNLAALLERTLEQELQRSGPEQLPQRMKAYPEEIQRLRRGELKCLARDASLLPDHAAIQYRYGLALYLNGETEKAEKALNAACRLEPTNDQFLMALVLYYQKFQQLQKALNHARQLVAMRPGRPDYRKLLEQLEQQRQEQQERQRHPTP